MKLHRLLALVAGLGFVTSAALAAGVYRWVDEKGEVHFSDRPQAQSAEQIQVKPIPRSSTPTADQTATPTAKPAPAADSEEARYCQRAKEDLQRYEGPGQLMKRTPDGKAVPLSEAEAAAVLQQARDQVKLWCKE